MVDLEGGGQHQIIVTSGFITKMYEKNHLYLVGFIIQNTPYLDTHQNGNIRGFPPIVMDKDLKLIDLIFKIHFLPPL